MKMASGAVRLQITGADIPGTLRLLTSRGVGTTVLPVRLFCRPQIHLITVNAGR